MVYPSRKPALLPELTGPDALEGMVVAAVEGVAPDGDGAAVLAEALRRLSAQTIPNDEAGFFAFASGALYDATAALVDAEAADALMGQVDWMREGLAQARTSGVFPSPTAEADALQGVRVLLVDDDAKTLRALGRCLSTYGATVVPAESADEAMALCATEAPDAVVTDYNLPVSSGATLASMLQLTLGEHAPPILCLTGRLEVPSHADFAAVLRKPVPSKRLVAAIAAACKRPAPAPLST